MPSLRPSAAPRILPGIALLVAAALWVVSSGAPAPMSLASDQPSAASTTAPGKQADARVAGAYRFERGEWISVHLEGSPEQIGYQYGYLLAPEIADAFAAVKLSSTHQTHQNWEFFRRGNHVRHAQPRHFPQRPPHSLGRADAAIHGKNRYRPCGKARSGSFRRLREKEQADERTLCGHADASPRGVKLLDWPPYYPGGAVQGKVTGSAMAAKTTLVAHTNHPWGQNFLAKPFLAAHPEYSWEASLLRDLPSGSWTVFHAGQRAR